MAEEYTPEIELKVNDYLAKMEQIAENRNFLPLRYFEEAEHLIRTETLQSYQQQETLPALQSALSKWRNQLASRNQAAILKWCNELLGEVTSSVDKKICKEIKSFTIYRQEISANMDLLRKKTEPYLTCQLSILIQDVMIPKIFDHFGQLHNWAINQVQDQLKVLEVENKALAVECREAKRRTNKEDSEAQRIISELREKLNLADVKYALLEQASQELKKELLSCQQTKEETLTKINQEFSTEISKMRSKLEENIDQSREEAKRSTYLQMELKKEKLLHEQTMLHYQELIANYHNKEEELKEEILEVSRVSEKEIDHFRSMSTRRIEDWQQTANDLKQQLDETLKALRNKESEALSIRQALVSLKETSRSQIDELNKKIIHLEYRSKMLEEKETQCQQWSIRFQKLEAELKRVQKDRDHSNELTKEYEKKLIIMEKELEELKIKVNEENKKAKNLAEQLKIERERKSVSKFLNEKQTINSFTQTNQDPQREKLKAALALIRQMEADYLKLQQSVMRKTYM